MLHPQSRLLSFIFLILFIFFSNPLTAEPFAATALSPTDSLNIAKPLGSGHGTVTSNPPGIDCGDACTANFTPGSSVTLTATPDAHSTFLGWTGACAGQNSTCALVRDASSQTVAAYFNGAAIAAGDSYNMALKNDGTLWAWGDNSDGQLGDGTTTNRHSPIPVNSLSSVVTIATAYWHTVAMKNDGTVWAWGRNRESELGDGTTTDRLTPVQVVSLSNMIAIDTQFIHAVSLKNDGTVWAWGANDYGQLGDGTKITRSVPVLVGNLSNVIAIAAGGVHTVALKSDGTAWAWGYNNHGQLGDGTTTTRTTPAPVTGLSNVIAIAAGRWHTLALKGDGTIWAWGYNGAGQLGNGTTIDHSTPALVSSLNNITAIDAYFDQSKALRDGTAWAWGANDWGQLGDGTDINRLSPVSVSGLNNIIAISAGYYNHTALKSDGTVWVWGNNYSGQLGNDTIDNYSSFTPVQVVGTGGTGYLNVYNSDNNALTISKTGTGSGTVTGTGIDCGADCSETYATGTSVTLTATPATGSTFAGWSGACSGTGTCQVTMSEARTVTATFNTSGSGLPLTVTATHTAPANYPVGSLLTLSSEFTVPAGTQLLSLVWRPTLPMGWSLQSAAGDGTPQVQGNAILFTEALTTNPLRFTYQIAVPANATGTQTLSVEAEYQTLGMLNPISMMVTPNALELRSSNNPHRVDYRDPPWQIDATEASRILAYWRAGNYHVNPAGADGYAAGPGSTSGTRHAADFSTPYWQIDGTEAARILAYWRAGGYHVDPAGADGYAPGLAMSSMGLRGASQDSAPQITHQLQSAAIQAGEPISLQVTVTHAGNLLSLLARPELPSGWTITEVTGEGSPQVLGNEILLTGQDLPNPLTFQYRVRILATAQGPYNLRTSLEYQSTGMVNPATLYAVENPLLIQVASSTSDAATTLITHYYTSILGREPDAGGLAFWQSLIAEKQAQGLESKPVFRDLANTFFNSDEYLGNRTSDTQFITDLYRTFFQREPDQGGMDFWRGQLAAGVERNSVMGGFLYSPEFTTFMEALGF